MQSEPIFDRAWGLKTTKSFHVRATPPVAD
jgi:hypothetical protein